MDPAVGVRRPDADLLCLAGRSVKCLAVFGKSEGWTIMDRYLYERGSVMAAMKPRTGDGPMEAVKEGRLIIVRVPLEGGGRLVVSVNDAEARELHDALAGVVAPA